MPFISGGGNIAKLAYDKSHEAKQTADQAKEKSDLTKNQLDQISQQLVDGSFETGILDTHIEQKLSDLETQYAPQLTSLSASLAQIPQQTYITEKITTSELLTPSGKVRFIAHRGFSQVAPEDTLPAYRLAAQAGFWGGETDVSVTSDGVWVIMHDNTVDRTTNGTGSIANMTLAEIKALTIDVGANIDKYPNLKVPTFEEYLITCKKVDLIPVIEIKSSTTYTEENYDAFVEMIRKHGFESKCVVISYMASALEAVRERSKRIVLQFLTTLTQENLDYVKNLGNAAIDVNASELTKELVELAHSNGILVNCWTVNITHLAQTMVDYGVDFITTDFIAGGVE